MVKTDKNKFLIDLCESDRTDFGLVEFGRQSEVQRVFSALWELEAQVNNGGFDQYFRNSDSEIIGFAPTALKLIGAFTCAEIVQSAIELIAPLPETQLGRYAALDALSEKQSEMLDLADSKFFEYPDNLTALLFDYVALHPEAFGPVPK
jgi:hypothetical protein